MGAGLNRQTARPGQLLKPGMIIVAGPPGLDFHLIVKLCFGSPTPAISAILPTPEARQPADPAIIRESRIPQENRGLSAAPLRRAIVRGMTVWRRRLRACLAAMLAVGCPWLRAEVECGVEGRIRRQIMVMATRYKEKLPHHLSYPVGLELLTTILGEVPQANQLSVWFVAHSAIRATEIEHKRRNGEYYPVLVALFHYDRLGHSECNDLREAGFYDPQWDIKVYAVSREHRAFAQKLLCEQGIPAIAAWLRTPRSSTWLQGRKQITVCFNEKDLAITVETDNP